MWKRVRGRERDRERERDRKKNREVEGRQCSNKGEVRRLIGTSGVKWFVRF